MDSTTELLPQGFSRSALSFYENGAVLFHSSEHIPENYFPKEVTEHTWFCYDKINVTQVIIGIPDSYFDDCARGHALYVTGVGPKMPNTLFESLFRKCGTVKKSVAVIDLNSGHTFRWIVMSSFQEAQAVFLEFKHKKFGAHFVEVCHAFGPGKVVPLLGRTISQMYTAQNAELADEYCDRDKMYSWAVVECTKYQPANCCAWFNNLISVATQENIYGTTTESNFVGFVDPGTKAALKRAFGQYRLWDPPKFMVDEASNTSQGVLNGETSASAASKNKVEQQADSSTSAQSKNKAGLELGEQGNGVPAASQVVAPPVVAATSATAPTSVAPAASAPVGATSSWANIAAPTTNDYHLANLMFDLHPENKPSSSAPRVQAPANPSSIAHQQGERLEEQMRVVLIYNLPPTITLRDVSDAISEGPVLSIKFLADADNGNRFAGIVFQYARDAHAFHQVLLQERENSTPGRFRFIVDVGQGPPYPYDDDLEDMAEPMGASRRLTIVKKGFFFQYGKKQLRKFCVDLVGAEKIQLIWFYNGGNASVVFSDVKSAVAVKTKLDRMAAGKEKSGNNMVSFEGLCTSFSKDPCFSEMNLVTDIPEYNED